MSETSIPALADILSDGSNHGWIVPRGDGRKARCGGPTACSACALEYVRDLLGGNPPPPVTGTKTIFTADAGEEINGVTHFRRRVIIATSKRVVEWHPGTDVVRTIELKGPDVVAAVGSRAVQ